MSDDTGSPAELDVRVEGDEDDAGWPWPVEWGDLVGDSGSDL